MTRDGNESDRLLGRREYVTLVGASAAALAGCSGGSNNGGGNGDGQNGGGGGGSSGIEPKQFSSSGQTSGESVQMQEGLAIGEATHDGTGQFKITLEGGQVPWTLATAEGGYEGKEAVYTKEREYTLNVVADGSWSLTIRQPRVDSAESPPVSFSGTGSDVVGPVDVSQEGSAQMSHDGQFAVAATFYPQSINTAAPLFQSFGEFEDDTAHPGYGIAWIDIDADGSWTLSLE